MGLFGVLGAFGVREWVRLPQILGALRAKGRALPKVPIGSYLDLSTGHLRPEARESLNQYVGLHADQTEYGWWMVVPLPEDVREWAEEDAWPPELLPIIELAWKHDCGRILFDSDAEVCEELQYFDEE